MNVVYVLCCTSHKYRCLIQYVFDPVCVLECYSDYAKYIEEFDFKPRISLITVTELFHSGESISSYLDCSLFQISM